MNTKPEVYDVLNKQFPMLYITLVSMVIALAAERLLSRIGEIEFALDFASLVTLAQCAYSIFTAALLWWVSARWVTTIAWRFSFFDGLSMLIMLIGLDFLTRFIDGNFSYWLISLGLFSAGTGLLYRHNGAAGLKMGGATQAIIDQHRLPAMIMVVAGVLLLLTGVFFGALANQPLLQASGLAVAYAAMVGFARTDLLVWEQASGELK